MARDPRIEQARERLRRLTDPSTPAGSRLERLRERARAARAERLGRTPPPLEWSPEEDDAPDAPDGSPTAAEVAPATPSVPAEDRRVAVPWKPAPPRTTVSGEEGEPSEAAAAPVQAPRAGSGRMGEVSRRLRALRGHASRGVGGGGVADAGRKLGSSVAGVGHWFADRWHTLPAVGRARALAVVIVVAVAALVWLVVLPAAPCQVPGGDACPPDDDAIALVPDDALAYVHLDVDSDTSQFEQASALAAHLPLLTQLAVAEVSSVAGTRIDFDSDIQPWSGGEVALAVLPGTGHLERVLMFEADDEDGARDFATSLLGATTSTTDVAGTKVSVGSGKLSSAVFDGFLLVGDDDALREIVDPPADSKTLADADPAALERLPEERLAYAYLSADGARALLGSGPLSSLDTFVDSAASAGTAVALSVDGDFATVSVRSNLDPERAKAAPGFFAALPRFQPSLTANVGADSLAYLGLGDPGKSIDALRGEAAADAPALLAAFDGFQESLRREGGISVEDDLLPLLGDEAAVSVEPVTESGGSPSPGVLVASRTPYVSLIANGVDEAAAAPALARLQQPLIDALHPADTGQVPAFESSEIAGVDAQSLFVSPQIDLTYSTFDDRLVVATDKLGIEQARAAGGGLAASPGFQSLDEPLPDDVSLFAYLNLRGLLGLGEQVGLAEDPGYATLAPDLRNLESAALAVVGGGDAIDTDLRVAVGQAPASGVEAPAPGGE